MIRRQPDVRDGPVDDAAFVKAVSLLAALEGTDAPGAPRVLPYLGMARAELVDFGQRQVSCFVPFEVTDLHADLADLDSRLDALLRDSEEPQHSLRIEAARRWVHRAIAARGDCE